MAQRIFLTLSFVLLIVVVQNTPFNKCVQTEPLPSNLTVIGCDSLPCNIRIGSNLTFQFTFDVDIRCESLKVDVNAYALNMWTHYPLPNDDACLGLLNGECPLEAGERVTYTNRVPIYQFPKVSVTIEYSIVANGNQTVSCFSLPSQVVDP